MREIKFRAWEIDKKVWAYFNLYNPETKTIFNIGAAPGRWELMQYTGLKDKNGVEIYEGDIVKRELRPGQDLNIVDYTGGGFYLKNIANDAANVGFQTIVVVDECEVIDNIYEAPDLLKSEQLTSEHGGLK